MKRKPDFNNILKVLRNEIPDRATLFEFFLNDKLFKALVPQEDLGANDEWRDLRINIKAYEVAGYDYVTLHGSDFGFEIQKQEKKSSISLNHAPNIYDWGSFENYAWRDPENSCFDRLKKAKGIMPEGMKVIAFGPSGVLENSISIVGYENLCIMILEEPDLAKAIIDGVGSRLLKYYEICLQHDVVGAIISNDDWGFNTQTMLAPAHLREYIFPWHKKIVDLAHEHGRPAILHSCGNFKEIWGDMFEYLKFDAKHSYEDVIMPVEEAYEKYHDKIAILGGMDLDFICRATPEEITKRSVAMLERVANRGGYALGTGNSVPEYVPNENYFAMIKAIELV